MNTSVSSIDCSVQAPELDVAGVEPFSHTLARHNIKLHRSETTTLQINVGLNCNQLCTHCHLEAGPGRKESMSPDTMQEVIAVARRFSFRIIDITGGAPEIHPDIEYLIDEIAESAPRLMFRTNLTILTDENHDDLIALLKKYRVTIVASLPSVNASQAESQRGKNSWGKSIAALKKLNESGYGQDGTDLELNLVSNPAGAFLPPSQKQAEQRFKRELDNRWGISFNHLFVFVNVPLGRYHRWLIKSGNLGKYMRKLVSSFNPATVDELMCRTLLSVSWDGYLFDCDFNLAKKLYLGATPQHVSQIETLPEPGIPVITGDHCYACTAGSGFT